ncbi:MAG: ubiquinone/menaquinone biosynthesis methyltransferase [Verrucomicrobiota bacterium]
MSSKFYVSGEWRAARVNDLFGTIAPRYDLINDLQSFGLHRLWKRRLLQLSAIRPDDLALDVCCGTGDISHAIASAGARVVGLDFSDRMLARAQQRGARQRGDRLQLVCADALLLPFPDRQFDLITVSYGLRNLADLDQGLREMWRTLKPAGRLVSLDFGKPANLLWRSLYFGYLKLCVPVFGRLFCGDPAPYAYILESLKHYRGQAALAHAMRSLNFHDVKFINLLGGVMSIHYGKK